MTNGGFESPGFTPSPDYYRYLHVVHGTENFLTGWNFAGTVQYEASYLMRRGSGYDPYIPAGDYAVMLNEGALMTTSFNATAGQLYQFSILARYVDPLSPDALTIIADGTLATFNPTATFVTYTFDFTAATTGPATLQLELDSSLGAPQAVAIDNVSITAIPEYSASTLASGMLVLLLVGCRRRARLTNSPSAKST